MFDWLFRERKERKEDESLRSRIYRLETQVEQLQLESSERQLTVLNAVEKVLHQLQARTRKREADKPLMDDVQAAIDREALPGHPLNSHPQLPNRTQWIGDRRRSNY